MLKRFFKWRTQEKSPVEKICEKSLFLRAFIGVFEDIVLWKNIYLSVGYIAFVNIVFFICLHRDVRFLQFILFTLVFVLSLDCFEAWLKYKHRTSCLRNLPHSDGKQLYQVANKVYLWSKKRGQDFLTLRESNHTKAFLLANIVLGCVFVLGKSFSGAVLLYLLMMLVAVLPPLTPYITKFVKIIHLQAESDEEIESMIPEISESNEHMLNFEAEASPIMHSRHSTETWLPDDNGQGDVSDSSASSNSLITNLSIEKPQHTLERDIDTSSDSSEDDYLPEKPLITKEVLKTTVEISEPSSDTWSSAAVGALWSLGGALTSAVYKPDGSTTSGNQLRRRRAPSDGSSDDFEFVDQNDLL